MSVLGLDAGDLLAAAASLGFGALSAVLPIANAEAYVAATRAAHLSAGLLVAITVACGQTIGKAALFLAVRHGKRLPVFRRHPNWPTSRWPRLAHLISKLLGLVGSRWGIPITLLGAITGIPPIYPLALIAGATRMSLLWFCAAVLLGRCIRFGLLAAGVDAGVTGWWRLTAG